MEFASHSGALGPRRRVHGLLGLQVRSSSCISDKRDNAVLIKQTNRRALFLLFCQDEPGLASGEFLLWPSE